MIAVDSGLSGWADPERRLRNALANDEFALFCQPILAFSGINRYPMGELLVRLREEEKALLPPGEFFPVFEHYRMMPQLDRWVVRSAIASLARGTGIPCLTINLSGQTLEDLEFPRFVASHLLSNKVPSRCLLFEIDESDTLIRFDAARRFSDAYREIGGGILIDGFGRKSVSFGAIQGLGPRFVKVDGSITRQLLASERAKRKMAALLTISQALNFSLIAEFVEEQDTLIRLKALGVGYAQGFGVYRPGPIESLKFSASRG